MLFKVERLIVQIQWKIELNIISSPESYQTPPQQKKKEKSKKGKRETKTKTNNKNKANNKATSTRNIKMPHILKLRFSLLLSDKMADKLTENPLYER